MIRALFFLVFCVTAPTWADWKTDYAAAKAEARAESRPLLVAFLGSDWCPWSKKFSEEVLFQEAFQQAIGSRFVSVRLEYFKEKELRELLKVEQVPALVLISAEGDEMARFGYLPFAPAECANYLSQAAEAYQRLSKASLMEMGVDGLKEAYEVAATHHLDDLRERILQAGLEKDASPHFKMIQYAKLAKQEPKKARKLRREIVKADPDNECGAQRDLAVIEFQTLADSGASLYKTVRPLKKYLKDFGAEDKEHAWSIRMILAQYYFTHGKSGDAFKQASRALRDAPENARDQIRETVRHFQETDK